MDRWIRVGFLPYTQKVQDTWCLQEADLLLTQECGINTVQSQTLTIRCVQTISTSSSFHFNICGRSEHAIKPQQAVLEVSLLLQTALIMVDEEQFHHPVT